MNDAHGDGLCCDSDSGFFLPDGSRDYQVYLGDELVGKRIFLLGSPRELTLRGGRELSPVTIDQGAAGPSHPIRGSNSLSGMPTTG